MRELVPTLQALLQIVGGLQLMVKICLSQWVIAQLLMVSLCMICNACLEVL